MRYMITNGPFKKSVIETEATPEELNSKPDIPITFVEGPLKGIISRSLMCYDRKLKQLNKPITIKFRSSINYGKNYY